MEKCRESENDGVDEGGRERVGERGSTMTLPCVSDVCCDPCALVSVRSCWGSWSLSVISNAVISSE